MNRLIKTVISLMFVFAVLGTTLPVQAATMSELQVQLNSIVEILKRLQSRTSGQVLGVTNDDTLSCLSSSGPLITQSQNFGYNDYSNRSAQVGTKFDFRGSTWLQEQVPEYKNNYAIKLGDATNGCFVGGAVENTTPTTADWRERYGHWGSAGGNSAGIFMEYANNFTFTGIRLKNVWDGIRVNRVDDDFVIKNNWIDAYDDCVENDGLKSGIVEDNYFEGCFVWLSARPGSNTTVTSSTGADAVVRAENNLVYMRAIPRDDTMEEGNMFKVKGDAGGPRHEIVNNLFMHKGVKSRNTDGSLESITSAPSGKIDECSGNVMIWLGDGAFPGQNWPNGCLEIVTGQEGIDLWEAAKENWINCHPEADRLASDPASDPSQCDPNGWGGGGTEMPNSSGTTPDPEPEPVPTGELSLSTTEIPTGARVGDTVAVFENGNLTGDSSYTVVLENGTGDDDNSYFDINNDVELVLAQPLGSNKTTYSIRTETRDGTERFDKVFTLTTDPVSEPEPEPVPAPAPSGDTYSCLLDTASVTTLNQDYGYNQYRDNSFNNGVGFDARNATWLSQSYSDNDIYGNNPRQSYPVMLSGGTNACFAGGVIEGTNPIDADRDDFYGTGVANGAGLFIGRDAATDNFTIDGTRIHNVIDGIRIGDVPNFTIKDAWLSYVRDDCVENDIGQQGGLIENSLFDGCYVFHSVRSSSNSTDHSSRRIEVRDTLVRMQPMPGPYDGGARLDPGYGMIFKWDGNGPGLSIHDSIFYVSQAANAGSSAADFSNEIADCSNNIMVWTGGGNYPYPLPSCFTVTSDVSVWEDAKEAWINAHTDNVRLDSDPGSTGSGPTDTDGDGIADSADNCPTVSNTAQTDTDSDGIGDACDSTPNGDEPNWTSNYQAGDRIQTTDVLNVRSSAGGTILGTQNRGAVGTVQNLIPTMSGDYLYINVNFDSGVDGWVADAFVTAYEAPQVADADNDGIADTADNCPNTANADQADNDNDGVGNVCDSTPNGDVTAPTISNVSASNITQSGATISWTTNELSTSQVFYGIGDDYTASTNETNTVNTNHSVTLSGLTSGGTYRFAVQSRDAAGNAAASQDLFFTTLEAPDTTRPNMTITSPSNGATVSGSLSITADANDPTVSGQSSTGIASVAFTMGKTGAATVLSTTDTSAPYSAGIDTTTVDNGAYTITVVATDGAGNTDTDTISVTINNTITPPADTTDPVISFVSNETTNNDPITHVITYATNEPTTAVMSFGTSRNNLNTDVASNDLSTSHTFILEGLSNKQNYYFELTATDAAGNSDTSGTESFRTIGKPQKVTNLTARSGSIILEWDAITDESVDEIILIRMTGNRTADTDDDPLVTLDADETSYTDKTAKDGQKYTYTMYTVTDGEYSEPTTVTFTHVPDDEPDLTPAAEAEAKAEEYRRSGGKDSAKSTSANSASSRVRTTDNLNVRTTPGGALIRVVPNGSQGTKTSDAPVQQGGYTWIKVEFAGGVSGWVAESFTRPDTTTGRGNRTAILSQIQQLLTTIASLQQRLRDLRGN